MCSNSVLLKTVNTPTQIDLEILDMAMKFLTIYVQNCFKKIFLKLVREFQQYNCQLRFGTFTVDGFWDQQSIDDINQQNSTTFWLFT